MKFVTGHDEQPPHIPPAWQHPGERRSTPGAYVTGLSAAQEESMVSAAHDARFVEGLTHAHYRYPARFSPMLARKAIELFTAEGDLVADPFVGGGTTCVEALAARRQSLGTDISSLATFVSHAKTTIANDYELESLIEWADRVSHGLSTNGPEPEFDKWASSGYFKNLGGSRWRLRRAIAQCVHAAEQLEPDLQRLARLVVLRTAQWALDGRRTHSGLPEFRKALRESGKLVAEGSKRLAVAAGEDPKLPILLNRSCIGLELDPAIQAVGKARLILTSPPYPGVHVLYHRWQVGGGKETAAPFFIANQLDGSGASYYTMGSRSPTGQSRYFEQLKQALASAIKLADANTTFIQVVAFSQPQWQLDHYLAVARSLGLEELGLQCLSTTHDGRLWREVPNRRWYNSHRKGTPSAQEVVLFHRLAAT